VKARFNWAKASFIVFIDMRNNLPIRPMKSPFHEKAVDRIALA
jgi:hypothetical protein